MIKPTLGANIPIIICCAEFTHIMGHWLLVTILKPKSQQVIESLVLVICLKKRDILKYTFFNENVLISINISLNCVPEGQINNFPVLVQMMALHQPGNKPLPEPIMFSLLMHIYITQLQWVKSCHSNLCADPTPIDFIYWYPDIKWVAVTW